MYKLTGTILIFISVTGIFCKRNINHYFTYKYLEEITDILLLLKSACQMGKTYNSVWSAADFDRFRIYNSEFKHFLVEKRLYERAENLIASAGQRNRKAEMEFLDYSLEEIKSEYQKYKNSYEAERKNALLCGLAVSALIVIVII